jgi:hypothetical protein
MRIIGLIVLAGALAGCGGDEDVTADAPDATIDRALQERACADAVAAHTGQPLDAMAPEWTGLTDTGTDIVFVRHAGSLHTCEVDATGRVLELQHPQE